MLFQNKVVIITGGSRGIGYATAEAFLEEGATVLLCASREETAQRALASLREKHPGASVEAMTPRLTDYTDVRETFERAAARYGRIDVLINNAGVSESTPLDHYTEELFARVMDLNVRGVYHCCRAVAGIMEKQGAGVILNTSSIVSITGQPAGVAYPTSKFAVNGLTLSLARELGPKGIRVNAVAPGITNTDMMRAVPKEILDPLIAQIPLRRLGEPEDIANAFVFLASEKASYITGAILSVDGMART